MYVYTIESNPCTTPIALIMKLIDENFNFVHDFFFFFYNFHLLMKEKKGVISFI